MEGCEARERRGNARGARRGGRGEGEGLGSHGRKRNREWKGVMLGNGEKEARGQGGGERGRNGRTWKEEESSFRVGRQDQA